MRRRPKPWRSARCNCSRTAWARTLVLVRQEIAAGRADAACERLARLRAEQDDAAMQMLLAGWHATACEAAGRPDEAARHWAVANPEFDASAPPAVS
jgi:hypothetical protein